MIGDFARRYHRTLFIFLIDRATMPGRFARQRLTSRRSERAGLPCACLAVCAATACALFTFVGCNATGYKAASLPIELQAAAAPTSTGINLERMVGAGVGTSQIGPGDLVQVTIVSGSSDERATPIP